MANLGVPFGEPSSSSKGPYRTGSIQITSHFKSLYMQILSLRTSYDTEQNAGQFRRIRFAAPTQINDSGRVCALLLCCQDQWPAKFMKGGGSEAVGEPYRASGVLHLPVSGASPEGSNGPLVLIQFVF